LKKMLKRLRSAKGESLIESMAAILIFTLASIILLAMISTSARLNKTAKDIDHAIETELLAAEQKKTATAGSNKVTFSIGNIKIDEEEVSLYRAAGDNTLYSYSIK